ncbi:MAG: manganese catalase family protein [Candidatus Coprenecus sp.]
MSNSVTAVRFNFWPAHFDPFAGVEELGHLEMIGAIVHQLTRNLSEEQVKSGGFDAYFVDHTTGVYPTAASGFPWSAASMAVKGDVIADLTEDLAAEGASLQEQQIKK